MSPSRKETWLCMWNLPMLLPRQKSRRTEHVWSLGESCKKSHGEHYWWMLTMSCQTEGLGGAVGEQGTGKPRVMREGLKCLSWERSTVGYKSVTFFKSNCVSYLIVEKKDFGDRYDFLRFDCTCWVNSGWLVLKSEVVWMRTAKKIVASVISGKVLTFQSRNSLILPGKQKNSKMCSKRTKVFYKDSFQLSQKTPKVLFLKGWFNWKKKKNQLQWFSRSYKENSFGLQCSWNYLEIPTQRVAWWSRFKMEGNDGQWWITLCSYLSWVWLFSMSIYSFL